MTNTLLIVDDEEEIRNGLFNYSWENLGFSAVAALSDGKEALTYLSTHSVDAAICDIRMPGMNGLELARKMKELKISTHIVFLTGYKDMEYIRSAIHAECFDYLLKPTHFKQLEEVFVALKTRLEQEWKDKFLDNCDFQDAGDDFFIQAALKYISSHLSTASLEVVSEFLNISPNYFSRIFKARTGILFSVFCQQQRLGRARELLKDPNNQIQDVALQVGYSISTNFSRAFKLEYGMSPGEFRSHINHRN
ncbi:response regulator [uncultured Sphaerochaeta sp.]|uniref:response regulator transcription factor n=1 Tax=uncultured Sphaerochaeta sp. TaxID=886478 RepID=UPI002A0A2363|nr:response regulator [uncultured Sphaerochaeta sp.]